MINEEVQGLIELLNPHMEEWLSRYKNEDSNGYWKTYNDYGNYLLSDYKEKKLISLASKEDPLDEDEVRFVAAMAGPMENGKNIFEDEDKYDDSVLDAYAEHLRNYLYQYKQKAQDIDPRINPEEKQIGIMAQDLEQVNPSCVKETPDGTKMVDTARLALMNAGAIADLAREVKEIKEMIKNGQ